MRLVAKIAFGAVWLGTLVSLWLIGQIVGWLPELLHPSSSLWLPAYFTFPALGAAGVVLGLFTLKRLGLDERKWAIGGIIGGALGIVTAGLLIWLILTMDIPPKF